MMEASEPAARTARNVASIVAVPWEVLGDGPARFLLLEMAYAGLEVRVCAGADGVWRVYLARQEMTCAEWSARFAV
jgi:hypothetical protein